MTKRFLQITIASIFIIIPSICDAQKYDNGLVDKTIALVGNDVILLSQMETEVQMAQFQGYASDRNLRCSVLENLMISKLFLTQARLDSLSVNNDQVNATLNDKMNSIYSQLGGEKGVEQYFGKSIFKLRQEWKETITDQLLVQDMQNKVANSIQTLTPSQVEEFYKKTPKDSLPIISTQYQLSQIVLYPDKKRAEMAVKERLLEFRERIMAGEKFSMLATLYSEDTGSSMKGGELGMASRSIFWPAFSDAAMSLKVGQVSPIVETPDGYHIIQMIEKDGEMFNVRHILLKPRYTEEDKMVAFAKLDSLKTAIKGDSISFFLAARFFSEDPLSRTNGGVLSDSNTGSSFFEKDQLKPADYSVLKNIKEGEISDPFESTDNEGRNGNTIYKIIKLDKIIPSHAATFRNDFNVLLLVAKQKQQFDAISSFIKEKQETTYIVIDKRFHNCDFERSGWIK